MTFTRNHAETTISSVCLLRARQGDSTAWDEIWSTYSNRVFRQILRFQLPTAIAEELTVDVFHKVWRNLEQFSRERPGESLGAWINRITSTSVQEYFRQQRRRTNGIGQVAAAVANQSAGGDLIREPSPCRMALWRALGIVENETSQLHWECFRLARFAGLPHSEIAQQLKMSVTNVSTIANRVYANIRHEAEQQRQQIEVTEERTVTG